MCNIFFHSSFQTIKTTIYSTIFFQVYDISAKKTKGKRLSSTSFTALINNQEFQLLPSLKGK